MVEIYPVHGTGDKRRGWFVDFYSQWPAILRPRNYNWHDWSLTVFRLAGENSPYKRSWEIEIGLFGFNMIMTYVYRDVEPEPSVSEPDER